MMAASYAVPARSEGDRELPLPVVRETVRDLLLSLASYHSLTPAKRRQIAQSLVSVCQTAVSLSQEEASSDGLVSAQSFSQAGDPGPSPPAKSSREPVALAQNAGEQFSGVSAQRVAGTTRAIRVE